MGSQQGVHTGFLEDEHLEGVNIFCWRRCEYRYLNGVYSWS